LKLDFFPWDLPPSKFAMPSSWSEPAFPYSIIYDCGTYFLLSIIFLILHKKKIININLLLLSLVFLLTPFLFNGLLLDWSTFPDQSKYVNYSTQIRDLPKVIFGKLFKNNLILSSNFYREIIFDINYTMNSPPTSSNLRIYIPSVLYAFSPILSVDTYKGIALFNRAIFLLTWIFFTKKKFLDKYNSIFFLIIPSLILYTSLALRESLIILLMLWFTYFFYQKRILFTGLTLLALFFLKYQMLLIVGIFLIFDRIIKNNSISFRFLFLTVSALVIFTFTLQDEILYLINYYRLGFFSEEFGAYKSISSTIGYEKFAIAFNLSSIPIILNSYLNFIIPPIFKGNFSLFYIIHLIEVFIIYIYLYIRINLQKNFNRYILCKWVLVLIFSYFIYSLIIFNDGTLHRYKIPILFFVIFGYFVNVKVKEKKGI